MFKIVALVVMLSTGSTTPLVSNLEWADKASCEVARTGPVTERASEAKLQADLTAAYGSDVKVASTACVPKDEIEKAGTPS